MTHPIEKILNQMGVMINGPNPWDMQIHDKRVLNRIAREGSIGAGESYMEGWWDCDQLDALFFRLCRQELISKFYPFWQILFTRFINSIINQQGIRKAKDNIRTYFSLSNFLYTKMLGKSMAYSCGYWKNANTLDEAQFAKYDLICKKLYLKPGDKILDIGCGWGGLVKYMAENYEVEITGVDVNLQSINYAKEHCQGLPITFYFGDYQDKNLYNPKAINYNKIVSIGMIEHVGYKNYDNFFDIMRTQLNSEGIFLLHSIGSNTSVNYCDPWINKYIFPNGHLPSLKQLAKAFENQFVVEDLHNFGAYYDPTLVAWNRNLEHHWPELQSHYNERIRRMMKYYLLSCAASFRARDMQLWQFVLTPKGLLGSYERPL